MEEICGIILNVSCPKIGNVAETQILGKTCHEWVKMSLGGAYAATVPYDGFTPLPQAVRRYLDAEKPYTVILYCDTPLISKKTVMDAVCQLKDSNRNVIKMTRGYVVRTSFLSRVDNIYSEDTRYFDEEDFVTAFDYRQVSMITDILKNRITAYHMENGVQFDDPSTAFIGSDVVIASGVRIGSNNTLLGKTVIKKGVTLKTGNVIEDCVIDENATVDSSRLYRSYVGTGTSVGPFAYIRPNCVIGENCRIGDFVELKNSIIGNGSKVAHLTYVGDCEMGENCNIGCGVVFVNYDGKNKYKTRVGNGVFIGSNSNIIAPLDIEDGAFIAAGSTLTDSVPEKALAIARARQVIKPFWQGNKYSPDEKK